MASQRIKPFRVFWLLLLVMTGCTTTLVKPESLDNAALKSRLPAETLLTSLPSGERALTPGPAWLAGLSPQKNLIFLGVSGEKEHTYGALLEIDLDSQQLHYLPLAADETPLALLVDPTQRAALEKRVMAWAEGRNRFAGSPSKSFPLQEINRRLTFPLAKPKQIFAVAANYPSHLFNDLSLPDKAGLIAQLRQARPRLFQKYPPVPAPGEASVNQDAYSELPGPFGTIAAPASVRVPTLEAQNRSISGHLDYEVEIAIVIGRELTWEMVQTMTNSELRQTVAGTLLFSDAKVRDPQVMGKIVQAFREEPVNPDNPYRVGDDSIDGTLGRWDKTTCHWWSYAASWGHYAAYGPFFVTAPEQGLSERLILSARSYSSAAERSVPAPQKVPKDQQLLRQATVTTSAEDYPDALIWDIPAIIRSLLDPTGNALAFSGTAPVLHAGDMIALGTPGGTVISAKPWWLLPLAEDLLFWKNPLDFYDMFFAPTERHYLHPGDELFLWGEGLGYQLLRVMPPGTGQFDH